MPAVEAELRVGQRSDPQVQAARPRLTRRPEQETQQVPLSRRLARRVPLSRRLARRVPLSRQVFQ